ncbi:nucleophile aminohydrolase [Schizothecium vesticola]|uniref:Nucleophile aminohydrolase n=1 Tax=Schizothecium vesticola TaxID=314040 RepID=A0AA40KD65_9PEZI|nr:nucleophile aminohydrolase [Schizothecium vesticola]
MAQPPYIDPVFPPPSANFMKFPSRRSVVHSTKGMVACTQPLAAKCGIDILNAGGNAAASRLSLSGSAIANPQQDAAVAVAAGLNMTEPCSTGIGGDMFCLYYDAATGSVSALNGSGRSGAACTLDRIRQELGLPDGATGATIPMSSVHAVTVPGAAAGWVDTVERFGSGKLTLAQILAPAIELGEKGFPVSELTAHFWQRGEPSLRAASPNYAEMLKPDPSHPSGYRAPRAGEIIKLPHLARTFRTLAAEGKPGFYTGRIASSLIATTTALGGHLTLSDLSHHLTLGSEPTTPISLPFASSRLRVWEHPPNGQGLIALLALGILTHLRESGTTPPFGPADHNTTPYLHAIISSLRLAFADGHHFIADPATAPIPTSALLSPSYLARRAALFTPDHTIPTPPHGSPSLPPACDTVYLATADAQGNAMSLINSNYGGFGTGIIPSGCGFTLQNRGAGFSLEAGHANVLAPGKRPFHTIIPGLVTREEEDGGRRLHSD